MKQTIFVLVIALVAGIQCGTKSDGGKIATVKFDEKTGTNIYE